MGLKTTLVLLLLVAGLGGVLLYTSHEPPPEESVDLPALDGRSLRQCARLRWQFTDFAAYEFERREDGGFRMTEPIVDDASQGHIEQIVGVWDSARLVATEYLDDEKGRRETGLEVPQATFLVEWPDGHRVEYDLGGEGPLGDRFLRRDGKIWRGGNGLLSSMRVNLDDLRDRRVFRNQEPFCTALRIEHETATGKREVLELQRRAGRWRITSPYDGRADQVTAQRFVVSILSLWVDTFLPGAMRPPEGDPDVVVVANGGGGEERLQLWLEQGAAYGQLPRRNSWFQADPRSYESEFLNAIDRLRAKTLTGMPNIAEELAEVVVDPGQGRDRVRLARDSVGNEWRLVEPVAYRTHPTPVNELIQALNNLRALEFVDGATAADPGLGLGGAQRTAVSLRAFEARDVQTLWLGAPAERGGLALVHACRADEPGTVVLVPSAAVEQLLRPWPTYCALDVVTIAVQVGRIELERAGEARAFGRQGDGWAQDGVEGARDDVRDFVNDELRDLHAKAAVGLQAAGLGAHDWVLRFCQGNGDRLLQLRVWDRAGQPLVVRPEVVDAEVGFELGANVSKQLRALWQ